MSKTINLRPHHVYLTLQLFPLRNRHIRTLSSKEKCKWQPQYNWQHIELEECSKLTQYHCCIEFYTHPYSLHFIFPRIRCFGMDYHAVVSSMDKRDLQTLLSANPILNNFGRDVNKWILFPMMGMMCTVVWQGPDSLISLLDTDIMHRPGRSDTDTPPSDHNMALNEAWGALKILN